MEKGLCWTAMGVAGFLLLLFVLDFLLGFPFSKVSPIVDIIGAAAAGLVLYLGWDAYKDLR